MSGYLFPLSAILLWAGNVIVSKMAAGALAPPAITFYRLVLAVTIMSCFIGHATWNNRAMIRAHLPKLAFLGFLSMAFYQCLSYWAAKTSTATNMAVITALVPLLTMALSTLIMRERPSLGMLGGGMLALWGIIYLISQGDPTLLWRGGIHAGDLLMLIASLSYAFYGVLLRHWNLSLPVWQSTYLQAWAALIFMLPIYAALPAGHAQLDMTTAPLIAYAGILGSIVLPFLWIQGICLLGPNRCSLFMNVLPVFTSLLALLLLDEHLHAYHLVGGGIAILGVIMAQSLARPLSRTKMSMEVDS
jgi:drug/metabolite transporter (DMT)-like permease